MEAGPDSDDGPSPLQQVTRIAPRVQLQQRPPSAFVTRSHRREDDSQEWDQDAQLPSRARPSTAGGLRRPPTATSRPGTAVTRPGTAKSSRLRPGTAGSSWRSGESSAGAWGSRRAPGEVVVLPSGRQTNVDVSLVRCIDHGKVTPRSYPCLSLLLSSKGLALLCTPLESIGLGSIGTALSLSAVVC
ncbi:hypothetical protein T484DRAFT_3582790 [Baffinella frigidus]|nr:hypothetical protein T484DRAFT_3582790 [Cryptophyta sp. CCMP2293]